MSNVCTFTLKATGRRSSITEFIEIILRTKSINRQYFDKTFNYKLPKDVGFPAYNVDISSESSDEYLYEVTNKEWDVVTVTAKGKCKWSIVTSMLNEGQYYSPSKDPNLHYLEEITGALDIIIELYSTELDIGFQEHIVIVNGIVTTEDVKDYKLITEDPETGDIYYEPIEVGGFDFESNGYVNFEEYFIGKLPNEKPYLTIAI